MAAPVPGQAPGPAPLPVILPCPFNCNAGAKYHGDIRNLAYAMSFDPYSLQVGRVLFTCAIFAT